MKVTKYIQSCFLVEENGSKILFDPGFIAQIEGEKPTAHKDIAAVIVTHAHGDHYDIPTIKEILQNNAACKVYCNSDMGDVLAKEGVPFELFEEGEREIAGVKVEAFFAAHEPLMKRVMCKNTAYVVNGKLLHTGDSYSDSMLARKVEAVCLAVAAPWGNVNQALDFVEKYSPKIVIPAHDGQVKEFFANNMAKMWEGVLGASNIKYAPLVKAGDSVEI